MVGWTLTKESESKPGGRLLCALGGRRGWPRWHRVDNGEKWSGSILKGDLRDFLMDWVWSVSERGAQTAVGSWLNKATRMKLILTEMGSGCGEQGRGAGGPNSSTLGVTRSR